MKQPATLNLQGVTIRFRGTGAALFENLDLTIAPGTVTTLMGPSGSGKSILLCFCGGFLDRGAFAASGAVSIGGNGLTACLPTDAASACCSPTSRLEAICSSACRAVRPVRVSSAGSSLRTRLLRLVSQATRIAIQPRCRGPEGPGGAPADALDPTACPSPGRAILQA